MFGERLRKLLDENAISPTQFADAIGVNRSAISHVINNRNNPGFDFIQKMNQAYPDWDFDWLLFERKQVKRIVSEPKKEDVIQKQAINQHFEQRNLFDDDGTPAKNQSYSATRLNRTVTKTILIYSDGTFEIFQNNFK